MKNYVRQHSDLVVYPLRHTQPVLLTYLLTGQTQREIYYIEKHNNTVNTHERVIISTSCKLTLILNVDNVDIQQRLPERRPSLSCELTRKSLSYVVATA